MILDGETTLEENEMVSLSQLISELKIKTKKMVRAYFGDQALNDPDEPITTTRTKVNLGDSVESLNAFKAENLIREYRLGHMNQE